jgi:site-specific DNA-methyltransferase (cytosine-N4-specific)
MNAETFHTQLGSMVLADSREYLQTLPPGSVDLVMTSPPFALVIAKAYGNPDQDAYLAWFRPFACEIRRVLKESGSLVMDVGGAWRRGKPVRSLYHLELPLMLTRELGFHLAQEFYWFNPCTVPGPAQWVNIRRERVKCAVNCVWWLSKTPWPKADNRRVLTPYGGKMRASIARGTRKARKSPSGHTVGPSFCRDNGGAIPSNLLHLPGNEAGSDYLKRCRAVGIEPHPARFPARLPEFFIKFLTDPGDLIVDPFAGSCVTGRVAEDLGRRWICVERVSEYLAGAKMRFKHKPSK